MSAHPVPMLLDWWSQLLKEHVQVEAERDRWECGGDHDPMDYEAHWAWVKQRMDDNEAGKSRDLGTPPGCFGQTAFERVTAIIIGRLPDQPFTVERLREFLAAGNLGPSDDPGFLETKRALEGMDLGLLAKELRREFDREPLQEHADRLAEFCKLVEAHANKGTDAPAPESPAGFLGGAELANALGVHPSRQTAFFQQLSRGRLALGDDYWHEVKARRGNSPKFIYRVDSPKLRDLAADYMKPD